MGLPILQVYGDVGEQINRGLKYKELSICPHVVEAVPGIASLYVLAEGLAYAVAASFVGMAWNTALISPYEHTVVIFGIFIDRFCSGKVGNDAAVNVPLFYQIGEHPAHIAVGFRQFKWLGRCLCLLCGRIDYSILPPQ